MAVVVYSGEEMIYAMVEATTFGTGMADATASVELSSGVLVFIADNKLVRPVRYRGQNWADVFDRSNNQDGSLPTVAGEMPALKTEIPDFLYMMMQNVTEAVDPFQKTFTYAAPSPDFTVNAGYFMTFWGKSPAAAAVDEKIDTVIGESLEFTVSPESSNGEGVMHMNFTGKGLGYSRTAQHAGTLTKSTQTKFSFFDIAVCTLSGTPVILQEMKITLTNEITPVGFDGTGDFQTFALKPMVTAEIKGIWDAGMRTSLGKFDTGAEEVFIINWGTTGTDGFFGFELHGNIDDGNHAEDSTRGVNITMTGASDLANTEAMLTAEICDAVDRSW